MNETIVGKLTYFRDEDGDPLYSDSDDMVTIMRSGEESIIEIKVSPDASKKKDALYIRIPAQVLMAALTKVLMGSTKDDEE